MKRDSRFGAHIGTSSLLLIFLTLSLVSFGALSLAGATADLRLSKKLETHTNEYYQANHEAEAFIARTDTALQKAWKDSTSAKELSATLAAIPAETLIPMNDTQALSVQVAFLDPDGKDILTDPSYASGTADVSTHAASPSLSITKWCIVNLDDSTYERHLPVSGDGLLAQ